MAAAGPAGDRSFFWRKLHSFTGLFPIGAFLAEHFWSNSYVLVSIDKYNEASRELQQIPWRIFVEAGGIWLPILFHGFYGIYVWWRGQSNVSQYPWMNNWMYTLQRWTGIVAFLFIGWHVYTERFLTHGKSTYADLEHAMRNPLYIAFYVAGILASSFHLGNGLWNFLCKWGIAATKKSQRAAAYLGAAVGIAFSVVGIAVVLAVVFHSHPFEFYTRP
ncbi:MAG: succinate dehydrogenase [Acidobacteria bacterium]|nr:succinate dehydrogenase [Acidobacteriota bacterium]